MSVGVGGIRAKGKGRLGGCFALGHNSIRGAEGAGVLIAELYLEYYENLIRGSLHIQVLLPGFQPNSPLESSVVV